MNKFLQFFGQQHVVPARLKQIKGLLNRDELLTLVSDLKLLALATPDHDFVIVGRTKQEQRSEQIWHTFVRQFVVAAFVFQHFVRVNQSYSVVYQIPSYSIVGLTIALQFVKLVSVSFRSKLAALNKITDA